MLNLAAKRPCISPIVLALIDLFAALACGTRSVDLIGALSTVILLPIIPVSSGRTLRENDWLWMDWWSDMSRVNWYKRLDLQFTIFVIVAALRVWYWHGPSKRCGPLMCSGYCFRWRRRLKIFTAHIVTLEKSWKKRALPIRRLPHFVSTSVWLKIIRALSITRIYASVHSALYALKTTNMCAV